jgi:hypothetical protein
LPVIPAFREAEAKDRMGEASLGYIARPCLKTKLNQQMQRLTVTSVSDTWRYEKSYTLL